MRKKGLLLGVVLLLLACMSGCGIGCIRVRTHFTHREWITISRLLSKIETINTQSAQLLSMCTLGEWTAEEVLVHESSDYCEYYIVGLDRNLNKSCRIEILSENTVLLDVGWLPTYEYDTDDGLHAQASILMIQTGRIRIFFHADGIGVEDSRENCFEIVEELLRNIELIE